MLLTNLSQKSRRKLSYSASFEDNSKQSPQEPLGIAQPLTLMMPNENDIDMAITSQHVESLLKPSEKISDASVAAGHVELLLKPSDKSTDCCNNEGHSFLKPSVHHTNCCIMERYGDSLFSSLYQPPKKKKLFKGLFTCEELEADISNDILTLSFSDGPGKVPLSVFNESADRGICDPEWKELPEDCLKLS